MYDNLAQENYLYDNLALEIGNVGDLWDMEFGGLEVMASGDPNWNDVPGGVLTIR